MPFFFSTNAFAFTLIACWDCLLLYYFFFFQMLSHLLDSLVGIAYITILLLAFSAAGNREGGDG